ncbi:hypothetical protein LINGRAHAP2_LOCUS29030, partial [Linum grandiflorum]
MWQCGLEFQGIYLSCLSRLVFHYLSSCSIYLMSYIYYILFKVPWPGHF